MRLEDLYENFGEATPEQQAAFMSAYRLRRAQDLAVVEAPTKRAPSQSKKSKIDLSGEEKALMKMLGLTQRDLVKMRTTVQEMQEEEDEGNLFDDGTFSDDEGVD